MANSWFSSGTGQTDVVYFYPPARMYRTKHILHPCRSTTQYVKYFIKVVFIISMVLVFLYSLGQCVNKDDLVQIETRVTEANIAYSCPEVNETKVVEIDDDYNFNPSIDNFTMDAEMGVAAQRVRIKRRCYEDLGMKIKDLKQYIPEYGGTPIQTIIYTTWRSGSTFVGELIQSVPGSFYHYEPLQIQRDPGYSLNETQIVSYLNQMFKCNYRGPLMQFFFKFSSGHKFIPESNWFFWKECVKLDDAVCFQPTFYEKNCKLFPFQHAKIIFTKMEIVAKLLEDEKKKMLYLVRDPRGTVSSRKSLFWCNEIEECHNQKELCKQLVSDYHTSTKLKKKYPDRFKIIRYEDLSLNLRAGSYSIMEFLGLKTNTVDYFVNTHSRINNLTTDDPYSTFRDSKNNAFKWMKKLSFDEVKNIQVNCSEALKLWGYQEIEKIEDLKTVNPLGNLNI